MVAAQIDVRHAQPADRLHVAGLRLAAEVGDVTGVDDDVDVELAHDRADHFVRRRVEVQAADVQHPDGLVAGGEHRQPAGDGIQFADVGHEPAELQAVRVEPLDDVLHVADDRRRGGEQPGEPWLGQGPLVDSGGRDRSYGGERGEPRAGRGEGGLPAAEHHQSQGGRAEHGHQAGTQEQ